MRGLHPLALFLAASVSLAGCSGGGGSSGGGPAGGPDGDGTPGAGQAANFTALLFEGATAKMDHTVWSNGTVKAQDTCNTGGCLPGTQTAFHTTDLTPHLPPGVPTKIDVAFDIRPNPAALGCFDVWVQSEDSEIYDYDYEWECGHIELSIVLMASGTVELVMAAYGPGDQPESPYTLEISMAADPAVVPLGVPVAVELESGDHVAMLGASGLAQFLLYAPSGAFAGSHQKGVTLADDAPDGKYVLLSSAEEAAVVTNATAPVMRAVKMRYEDGPVGTLPPTGAYDGTWDVSGYPAGVGIAAYTEQNPTGFAPVASGGFMMSLTGPNGFALESGPQCQGCFLFGYGIGFGSGLGDGRVTSGTYEIHAETDATVQLRIQPWAVYFEA